MEAIKQSLLNLNIGAAQKVWIYSLLKDIVPATYIDIYSHSDKNTVFQFLSEAKLSVAEMKSNGSDNHTCRIAIAKDPTGAQNLANAIEEHDEKTTSLLMGEPESVRAGNRTICSRQYPPDFHRNPLIRFSLTRNGFEEQVAYIRGIMENLKGFPELAREFHLDKFEGKHKKVVA